MRRDSRQSLVFVENKTVLRKATRTINSTGKTKESKLNDRKIIDYNAVMMQIENHEAFQPFTCIRTSVFQYLIFCQTAQRNFWTTSHNSVICSCAFSRHSDTMTTFKMHGCRWSTPTILKHSHFLMFIANALIHQWSHSNTSAVC